MDKETIIEIRDRVSGESRFHFSYILGVDVTYVYKLESGKRKAGKSLQKLMLMSDELNNEEPSVDKLRSILKSKV